VDEVRVVISGILLKYVKELTLAEENEDGGFGCEILELWTSIKALPHLSPGLNLN